MTGPLLDDRAKLQGLRLVRDLMSRDEREILTLLEAEARRTDTVAAILHDVEAAGLSAVPVPELRLAIGLDR